MTTIRENAMAYEPKETKNIADLEKVNTELELKHKIVNEGTPEQFEYDYTEVDGVEYRVPLSVQKQLKTHLEEKPDATEFKVKKTGTGMSTEYTVMLL